MFLGRFEHKNKNFPKFGDKFERLLDIFSKKITE